MKRTSARSAPGPKPTVSTKPAKRTKRTAAVYATPKVSLPSGILSTEALLPTAQKLPFLAVALAGLAILLLAVGALPAALVPNPAFAEALVERRVVFAAGGLAMLAASIAAYILV